MSLSQAVFKRYVQELCPQRSKPLKRFGVFAIHITGLKPRCELEVNIFHEDHPDSSRPAGGQDNRL